jgi:hypothetical protein
MLERHLLALIISRHNYVNASVLINGSVECDWAGKRCDLIRIVSKAVFMYNAFSVTKNIHFTAHKVTVYGDKEG